MSDGCQAVGTRLAAGRAAALAARAARTPACRPAAPVCRHAAGGTGQPRAARDRDRRCRPARELPQARPRADGLPALALSLPRRRARGPAVRPARHADGAQRVGRLVHQLRRRDAAVHDAAARGRRRLRFFGVHYKADARTTACESAGRLRGALPVGARRGRRPGPQRAARPRAAADLLRHRRRRGRRPQDRRDHSRRRSSTTLVERYLGRDR